jgi:uncharacterized membrane protein
MGKSIQRFLHLLMLIILLPISAYVLMYYWTNSSSEGLRVLPTLIWSSIIVYIVIQLIKRLITKRVEWYEYTYYLGLSAILIPFVIPANPEWLFSVTRYGTIFLAFPPVMELIRFSQKKI